MYTGGQSSAQTAVSGLFGIVRASFVLGTLVLVYGGGQPRVQTAVYDPFEIILIILVLVRGGQPRCRTAFRCIPW